MSDFRKAMIGLYASLRELPTADSLHYRSMAAQLEALHARMRRGMRADEERS